MSISVLPETLKQIASIFNTRKKKIYLSKYSVGNLIAQGGMANVYELKTRFGQADYVLRVSEEQKSPYSQDIFNVREMDILRELKRIRQPHVVQYLDAFIVDIPGQPRYYCAVMKKLIPLITNYAKQDYTKIAVMLGNDLLPLLQSLVDREIIHRDIKPENIFYDGDFRNSNGFLLGDFGIAKKDKESSATPIGTDSTMAPEIRGLDREIRHDKSLSDMYSLGIVMYYYLNEGVYPSNKERLTNPPDKNPFPEPRYGSKRLKQLVVKATQYNPKDRFASPQEMLRELQQCEEYATLITQNVNSDAPTSIPEQQSSQEGIQNIAYERELQGERNRRIALEAENDNLREASERNRRELQNERKRRSSIEAENQSLKEKLRQAEARANSSSEGSDPKSEHKKLLFDMANPMINTVFALQIIMAVLTIVMMVYIRIIGHNKDLISQFKDIGIINLIMSCGDGWAHLIFSAVFCGIVLIYLIISRLCNSITSMGLILGFISSFAIQSIFVLICHWINPPFNTRIEQICWFAAVNLFCITMSVFGMAEDGPYVYGTSIGISAFMGAFGIIPSFLMFLPNWWGLIISALLIFAGIGISIFGFVASREERQVVHFEKKVFRKAKPVICIMLSVEIIMALLTIGLMVYIRIIGHNADLIHRFKNIEIIKHIMSFGDGWAHLIFSLVISMGILVVIILLGMINRETFMGAIIGTISSLVIQSVFILICHWIAPPFNTRLEQMCLFAVVSIYGISVLIWEILEEECDFGEAFGISLFTGAIGIAVSFAMLLPNWWGLCITTVLIAIGVFISEAFIWVEMSWIAE